VTTDVKIIFTFLPKFILKSLNFCFSFYGDEAKRYFECMLGFGFQVFL